MDTKVVNYLISRSQREDERRGRRGRDYEDERRDRDYEDERRDRDYEDERRGRSGRFVRDRRDYDYEDREDFGEEPLYLTKKDMHKWKKMLKNFDGSMGEHYSMDQIIAAANRQNITFDDYDEKEFCVAVNMMYADYGGVLKKYVSPEKELPACIDFAKAFLEDVDEPEPSEKLALYFHCIVCSKV